MKTPKNFARYQFLAKRFLKAGRLPALLLSVALKREKLGNGFAGLADQLKQLQALCLAWWRGEYRAIDSRALLAVVAALLYFVTPLDAIPDWLLGFGLVDDLAVLAWVLRTWQEELAAFQQWRADQAPEVLQAVERLPDVDESLVPLQGRVE
ncbi:YkvA family protein [Pseudomonas anguilliseptica]|uniref:YkvA family protein n=1 Tax=Pseudomonas anguilliseptica TaxID=53406 RepID=UPI0022B00E7E|nr:YkvA family protein [Pseudomonas anguilliseptica]MCZ4324522.1 YkvA family protein [Pseudomonas anguilliseptica]